MNAVLGELLPLAIGVALSPIPIVAAILMILSRNAGSASTGFTIGWVAGIGLATTVFVILSGALGDSDEHGPAPWVFWLEIGLGVLLVGLAWSQWRQRSATDAPSWMRTIDDLSPSRATVLGLALAAVNPKNLVLCVSAGVMIGSSTLGVGSTVLTVLLFTVLAAGSVLGVVLGYHLAADQLRDGLDQLRQWLQTNNHTVMAVVLGVLGAVLLGKGVGGL